MLHGNNLLKVINGLDYEEPDPIPKQECKYAIFRNEYMTFLIFEQFLPLFIYLFLISF